MVKDYLNTLKIKGNFTCADIARLSGIPEVTIRKILSGDTADPRFETIVKLVNAMGGSMDDIAGGRKESEIETNAVIALKELYDSRIADLKQDKKILMRMVVALVIILATVLILDITFGSHGWVRY